MCIKNNLGFGTVHIVGAGVGKKEWITVEGRKYLESADVILYDDLINNELLEYASDNAKLIYVGKRKNKHSFKQKEIDQLILENASKFQNIVRLKGGDPYIFGRGFEESLFLKENKIPYTITPGLSSSTALPEATGIPVTFRNVSQAFLVITAQTAKDKPLFDGNIKLLVNFEGTIIILMGYTRLEEIQKAFIENGKNPQTTAAVISSIDGNTKWVYGLLENIYESAKEAKMTSPAIIVIGWTVDLARILNSENSDELKNLYD